MKLNRIYAVLLRNIYILKRSYDRLSDSFYWITLDLLLWGITGAYFEKLAPNYQTIIFMLISGVVFWNITYRVQSDITVSLLEELWNKNLINLFVSPLKFKEFIGSLMILGIVKSSISLVFGFVLAFILYKLNFFFYSFHLLTIFFLLVLNGLWVGFLISSIILRYGTRLQTFAWTFVYILSPFSAVYYPLDILPKWAQYVSKIVPTSYVFEESRNLLTHGTINYMNLFISLGICIIYIIVTFAMLNSSFKAVLNKGLVKVY